MTKGRGRFEYFLVKLDDLLTMAAASDNPALYLYQNDARTPLFMLEGLAKLYACMHNKKIFSKLQVRFKSLEDILGAIDYYDCFAKDFLADAEMPSTIRMAIEQRRAENISALNVILKKKKWLSRKKNATKKIRKKLAKPAWKEPLREINLIRDVYANSVQKINDFYANCHGNFTDIESQVHALRRKLRWLSIYPQALKGAIQLADSDIEDTEVEKYLVPEIVNSPFNKMPAENGNEIILFLEKNYFLALSYMIAALGKIKDRGLRVVAVKEAVALTQFIAGDACTQRALELNGLPADGLEKILAEAELLCAPYFAANMTDRIVAATQYPVDEQEEAVPATE